MAINTVEKFNKTSLKSLSNNLYSYLRDNNDKRIVINESFDFDDYKESVRLQLCDYCNSFIYYYNSGQIQSEELLNEKIKLKIFVEDILDNEKYLENYSIFKIQQFINRVIRTIIEKDQKNIKHESKKERYIEYKDIEIDISNLLGFETPEKIATYLYGQFNLKRRNEINFEEISNLKKIDSVKTSSEYLDEITKALFEMASSADEKGNQVYRYPAVDDKTIFRYFTEGNVAELNIKKKKRILRSEEDEDLLYD